MAEIIAAVLTIGICYLLGHWDEIMLNNSTTKKGYHVDNEAVNRDLVLKGKKETIRKYNNGYYDVKDSTKK